MSEHFQIQSKIDFHHLPSDRIGSMCWCQFCNKTFNNMIVLFHDGISSSWIEVRCGKCKKCVYTSKIDPKIEILDKKCYICKKPTSYHNAICTIYPIRNDKGKKEQTICSKKCYKKYQKVEKLNKGQYELN